MSRSLLIALMVTVAASGCTLGSGPIADRFTAPGDAARDLVSGSTYANLLVEIDHPSNAAPDAASVDVLKSTLRAVTGKAKIDVKLSAGIPNAENGRKYSTDDLRALERAHRNHHTGGDTAVVYILYVSGGSTDDTESGRVLGVTYGGTSIAMFKGNIRDSSSGGLLATKPRLEFVERAVLVHEWGHAAGLVNLGTKMVTPHEDPEHPKHSSNKKSVMYWAVESSDGLAALLTGGSDIPYQFDDNDKADLNTLK